MKQTILLPLLLLVALVLSACGVAPGAVEAGVGSAAIDDTTNAGEQTVGAAGEAPAAAALTETLLDEQGAVTVSARPVNLGQGEATLDFEIAMNTHSVDLSMNLASLATLTTDTGQKIEASAWDAPQGGHHVSGVLSFPATAGGTNFLDGATEVTLTVRDVDAAARTFIWNLK